MVVAILETNVIVDLLRNYPPAVAWYKSQPADTLATTPIVWMEAIGGAPNKVRRLKAANFLRRFPFIYPTEASIEWAMQAQITYELQYGVGMNDCLIASASYQTGLPVYTHNLKHYRPLLGQLAQKPY